MKLALYSDLHLETGPFEPEPDVIKAADVIIAAGDIGVGTQGVEFLKGLPKPVIYVLGNHEYWTAKGDIDMAEVLADIRAAAIGTNVHVLENDAVVIDGVRFAGCTLWTDYAGWNRVFVDRATWNMNDYRHIGAAGWHAKPKNKKAMKAYAKQFEFASIRARESSFNPRIAFELHLASLKWLGELLGDDWAGETVVVSHHAPSLETLRRFGITDWQLSEQASESGGRSDRNCSVYRAAYASDLDDFLVRHARRITTWCHGHVHAHMDYARSGVRVVANPRGYFRSAKDDAALLEILGYPPRPAREGAEPPYPYAGNAVDFMPELLVDTTDGLIQSMAREIDEAVEDIERLRLEAVIFVDRFDSTDYPVRTAFRESFERRVNEAGSKAKSVCAQVATNLMPSRGLPVSGQDLLWQEALGQTEWLFSMELFPERKQKKRTLAKHALRELARLEAFLKALPRLLDRRRSRALRIAKQIVAAFAAEGVAATIGGAVMTPTWRHAPEDEEFEILVDIEPGPSRIDRLNAIAWKIANPDNTERRMQFRIRSRGADA